MGIRVRNITKDRVLGNGVREACSLFSRMKGLLGVKGLSPGEGLWICPCNSIHSFGMSFEFDALFLDTGMSYWDARGVLELPEGMIERTGTEIGDEIEFRA
jgi:uncharacterized membrane protein (UPF0127 family)